MHLLGSYKRTELLMLLFHSLTLNTNNIAYRIRSSEGGGGLQDIFSSFEVMPVINISYFKL